MHILIINGPNLNMLDYRANDIYGSLNLEQINKLILDKYKNISFEFFHSNHEGAIIDKIQSMVFKYDALLINAGAFSHYSYAIYDALQMIKKPKVNVHLSNIYQRELFRHKDIIAPVCDNSFLGEGIVSYFKSIDFLITVLER